ncbi:cytochrome P450 [Novosphingobium bradum]|uniref:Cytochrome P450 n=1 Tax=Novosphingobium bradum TaxID=1737444 RepID=A0ABV7IP20_9SPHN
MSGAPGDVLNADDSLYDELYDVRSEAIENGNFLEMDPYPLMNAARDRAPVHKGFLREVLGLPFYHRHRMTVEGRQGYAVLGYDLAEKTFRDNVRLSNRVYHMNPGDFKMLGILEMDSPEHFAHRKAAQSLFIKPRAVGMWRDRWINEIVGAIVGNLQAKDRAELNMTLCARVPVHTITAAVGLRGEQALAFRKALVNSLGTRSGRAAQAEGMATVDRMVTEQIELRRKAPGEDIISWLLAAEIELPDEGPRTLNDVEIVTFCRLLLLAGGGTTWRQMGIVLYALLVDRSRWEDVKADRSLVEPAIQESMRWNPNNPMFSRLAVQDTEIGGMEIPAGSVVDICLAAANRDPPRWDNPDVYDLHRPFRQHIGFGVGAHMCLGRNVAESEMYVAINALMDHFPDLRIDPDQPAPYLTGGLEQRGISGLHVLLK